MRKTLKRETSIVLVGVLMALSAYAMMSDDPALVSARASIVGVLAIPILGFAAAAFGMDWMAKQTDWGGPRRGRHGDDWPSDIVPPEQYDVDSR